MPSYRVSPRNKVIKAGEYNINTRIYQRVNQKGYEAPMITLPRAKDINIGRYNTGVHLYAVVPPNIPKGKSPKPNKL